MSAAGYILAINIFVAGLFATAFGLVALYSRSRLGARWLSLAYSLAILNSVLEFVLPNQTNTGPMEVLIFAVALTAFIVVVIGLAYHYELSVPWGTLAAFALLSMALNLLTLELPYRSLLRNVLYQAPYAIIHIIAAWVVFRKRRSDALQITLLVFLFLSGLQFVAKPVLAAWFGSAGPQFYLQSQYAAMSQMMTVFLLVTNGLLMLLIIARDTIAEIAERSETDKLSGLFNRRGFEEHADRLLALAGRTNGIVSLVVADLDHFKRINDSFGHEAGDRVIEAFAGVLRQNSHASAVLGRMGGEEFAVLAIGTGVPEARIRAEQARLDIAALVLPVLPQSRRVTASFGVARYQPGDSLSDLLRRADAALYEAKKAGRNAVRTALETPVLPVAAPLADAGPERRGLRRKA